MAHPTIDRNREYIQEAVQREGFVITPEDKELLALNERQRSIRLDDLTIRAARDLTARLHLERKRVSAYSQGINDTIEQLRRIVGAGTGDND